MRYWVEIGCAAVAAMVLLELWADVADYYAPLLGGTDSLTYEVVEWCGRLVPISCFLVFVSFRRQNRDRTGR